LSFLLHTNVAIHLRDGDEDVAGRVEALGERPALSIVSRVELENGVYRDPQWTAVRRAALDAILRRTPTVDFGEAELKAYRRIVEAVGYSRPRTLDRMIAAAALVHGLTLITMNGSDFRDVPDLKLEVWPSPSP